MGTITPDDFAGWPPGTGARFARGYDPRAGHRHVHGANLGVRADAYAAVGGFRALDAHEDVDLVTRLEASGRPIVWGAHAPVRTSTRRIGRAEQGFAAYLRRLADQTPRGDRMSGALAREIVASPAYPLPRPGSGRTSSVSPR